MFLCDLKTLGFVEWNTKCYDTIPANLSFSSNKNAEGSRLCHMEEALYRMRCDAVYYNVSWELCACSVHMSVGV